MEPVDVRALMAAPATTKELSLREPLEGLRGELARVPPEEPVEIELRLESVVEGILASGRVAGSMTNSCARCLKDFAEAFGIDVAELFAEDVSGEDDDVYPITDGSIDLEPMVRDAVVLAIPFSPLCRPDCLGLCERCGGDRNVGECTCTDEVDPRWAALDSLQID